MSFSSINIQGNIISSEILDKIRTEEKFKHQSPEAFGISRNASLRDEIGMAWSIVRTHWQAYKKRLETLPKGDTGTSLTREKLILPLLTELGYEVSIQRAQQINGKSYAISHSASNRDQFPIHIMGFNDNLDKRRDIGGPRLSSHALVQEYLNNTEHLYALVTNGRQLRLLRDATRLVRMSYLEFDLERMFEEELYADFSILFRVLHASRMPEKIDSGPESVIEFYHQESMASGTRIREKLSEAVENSIKTLANGFLENKRNEELTQLVESKRLSADEYYMQQLRLIYRILFLIVLEERKLVYPEELTDEQQRFRDIYYRYYSVERLRKLTENRVYVDEDKYDLWESLKTTFLLFEKKEFGSKIGIQPLGSGLFDPNGLGKLNGLYLNNGNLIEVLKRLTTFMSDQGQLVRVNYSDLDVEEFGSIYEGLLEYDPVVEKVGSTFQFSFVLGDGRSSSGSHYTPEELVKPLIKHSLDYIIEDKLKEPDPEKALLSITVCDVACGSGHILLSAARKIATELASLREGAEQPSPTYYRAAIKDVIRHCIYGVDLNPLAVELCKVALWLEAHNPNEPLNFLDHHIKCGNAIVGLAHFEELKNGIADEAFKTLPGDDKKVAAEFRKRNSLERKTGLAEEKSEGQQITLDTNVELGNSLKGIHKDFAEFVTLPETTPEEITRKEKAYKKLTNSRKWYRLNNLADLQVAQFFIPKTVENKQRITTDAKYRTYLNAGTQILDRGTAMAIAQEKRFFHWFLEFPQVFANGGFDCILGNPPFLNGLKITEYFGDSMNLYLVSNFKGGSKRVDLAAYFFRRDFELINSRGFFALISTNTISQGKTREGGLDVILKNGGTIVFASKSVQWPGEASVVVSLCSIAKGHESINRVLNNKNVEFISSLFEDEEKLAKPYKLFKNTSLCFQGSNPYGKEFEINEEIMLHMLSISEQNNNVVRPYLGGKELNSRVTNSPSRWIINFHELDLSEAKKYTEPFKHVESFVKPERNKRDAIKYPRLVNEWWKFWHSRQSLYDTIGKKKLTSLIGRSRVSNLHIIDSFPPDWTYSEALIVFLFDDYDSTGVLQSNIHEAWTTKYSSTMKNDVRYIVSDCFEAYPFPNQEIKDIGTKTKSYFKKRNEVKSHHQIGLTKLYRLFHTNDELELTILKLRELHKEMDEAVLAAYGWQDIDLRHDFYEVDYLPENDRVRYTIHPEARKEVLKRLLMLNHERYEEEIKQGLHKKKDVLAFYAQRNEDLPADVKFSDAKSKKPAKKKAKTNKVAEPQIQYGLFEETAINEIGINSKVHIKNSSGDNFKYHILKSARKDAFSEDYKQINPTTRLAENMLGRKTGDKFQFGGVGYEIIEVN
ncbi:MAG: GreA/GreB family elongation factor [Flavobacteriales bacterium]|nr:GreA/GreB family elongation factor [Flavobacteriales bacterium]